MGVTEIVLIIAGAIILVLSYVLPSGKKEGTAEPAPGIDEGQIKELIEKEIKEAKSHINDIVDETVTYSMEKTERAMERLTNEKIMAVNEYSDQVLEAINKNHQEVIFLYDMLNDKHENLVNTVSEAAKKAQEIKQTVQDAEITVREASDSLEEEAAAEADGKAASGRKAVGVKEAAEADRKTASGRKAVGVKEAAEADRKAASGRKAAGVKTAADAKTQDAAEMADGEFQAGNSEETEFIPIAPRKVEILHGEVIRADERDKSQEPPQENGHMEPEKSYNNNEKILRLHKLGKSKTAIAKELGLGVGEVKLVIDLFEQA